MRQEEEALIRFGPRSLSLHTSVATTARFLKRRDSIDRASAVIPPLPPWGHNVYRTRAPSDRAPEGRNGQPDRCVTSLTGRDKTRSGYL